MSSQDSSCVRMALSGCKDIALEMRMVSFSDISDICCLACLLDRLVAGRHWDISLAGVFMSWRF